MRRSLRSSERMVVPRVCDLDALVASTAGKIEVESLEEGRDGSIIENMLKAAVLSVYKARVTPAEVKDVVSAFEGGLVVHTGEDVTSADLARVVTDVPSLRATVLGLTDGDESPAAVASAVEFLLEGLHLSKRLNKDAAGGKATYRSRA
jgi:magnesium chelatase subunit I